MGPTCHSLLVCVSVFAVYEDVKCTDICHSKDLHLRKFCDRNKAVVIQKNLTPSILCIFLYIYVCFDVCVHLLHMLLWVWQSRLEDKISLDSLERHYLLEVMQKYRGKCDGLTHWNLSQGKLFEQLSGREPWSLYLLHSWVSCPNLPFGALQRSATSLEFILSYSTWASNPL